MMTLLWGAECFHFKPVNFCQKLISWMINFLISWKVCSETKRWTRGSTDVYSIIIGYNVPACISAEGSFSLINVCPPPNRRINRTCPISYMVASSLRIWFESFLPAAAPLKGRRWPRLGWMTAALRQQSEEERPSFSLLQSLKFLIQPVYKLRTQFPFTECYHLLLKITVCSY